jgi:chaperone modulatory protein CbpM
MELDGVLRLLPNVQEAEVLSWVERGWVRVDANGDVMSFTEIDVARCRLVRELRTDLAVGEDVMPVVLSLIDQVNELRAALKAVRHAIEQQPEATRVPLLAALRAGEL